MMILYLDVRMYSVPWRMVKVLYVKQQILSTLQPLHSFGLQSPFGKLKRLIGLQLFQGTTNELISSDNDI